MEVLKLTETAIDRRIEELSSELLSGRANAGVWTELEELQTLRRRRLLNVPSQTVRLELAKPSSKVRFRSRARYGKFGKSTVGDRP